MIPVLSKVKLQLQVALDGISMHLAVSTVATMCLLTACGGGSNGDAAQPPSASTSASPTNVAPVAPQTTPATVTPSPQLAALAADQPYVDNTEYSNGPTDALPSATEGAAVTHHRILLNGVAQTYTATTGHLVVRNTNNNVPQASIFYTAYTLDNQDVTKRPVTVFFNGGPGSPSSFLHMGSFGPMRVFTRQGSTVSGPNDVTLGENPQTLLDKTDMIFVDPVATGFSEAIAPSKNQDFWGVNPDVGAMAGFINRYVTLNNRGTSPLMVYGESYGGPRAGILSYALHNLYSIKLSGLIMQSPALNFYETSGLSAYTAPRRDQRPPFLLPTIAMAAQYFDKITDPTLSKLSPADLFQTSENFIFNDLNQVITPNKYNALYIELTTGTDGTVSANPDELSELTALTISPDFLAFMQTQQTQAARLLPQFQAFTGNLPVLSFGFLLPDFSTLVIQTAANVITASNLNGFIATNLAQSMIAGNTLGAYDLRKELTGNLAATQGISEFTAVSSNNFPGSYLVYDPSLNDLDAYDSIFKSYAYNTLKYQTVSNYLGLGLSISSAWNFTTSYPDGSTLLFPDATIFIADEMQINPDMQVMTTAGYYDSVVPAAQVDWDMQSVSAVIPKAQMDKMYTRLLYPGGHMSYADDVSRQSMHDSLQAFYVKATQTSVASTQ
jgi:carboxypeptidase C (cathepsin A)